MLTPRRASRWATFMVVLVVAGSSRAFAQGPTVNPDADSNNSTKTSLGVIPGSGASVLGSNAGAQYTGGRPGPSAPHSPTSIFTPGGAGQATQTPSIAGPTDLQPSNTPIYGSLALPSLVDDEGPADGLTLDGAIERLVRENLELRGQYLEIPQAQADILTASLRSNPVFYADAQLVPYGVYSNARPGGQTQYDVNISYPLDLTHKRAARTLYACRAKRVLEAQYTDAVRKQIDNLYTAWVDVLEARGGVRFAEAGVEGLKKTYDSQYKLFMKGEKSKTEVDRVRIQYGQADIGLIQNRETLMQSKRTLAGLLNMTPDQAETLDIRGPLRNRFPSPPPSTELVRIANVSRPDIIASRMGIALAEANLRLAKANVLQDVYLLYQPYTLQDNTYQGLKSATSWAVGITVPVPIYNRNQGQIRRSALNIQQTRIEAAKAERDLLTDVRQAEQRYYASYTAVKKYEESALPDAETVLSDTQKLFDRGEINVIELLNGRRDYNEVARAYLTSLVTHRRSMLDLNTSLGQRLLP